MGRHREAESNGLLLVLVLVRVLVVGDRQGDTDEHLASYVQATKSRCSTTCTRSRHELVT